MELERCNVAHLMANIVTIIDEQRCAYRTIFTKGAKMRIEQGTPYIGVGQRRFVIAAHEVLCLAAVRNELRIAGIVELAGDHVFLMRDQGCSNSAKSPLKAFAHFQMHVVARRPIAVGMRAPNRLQWHKRHPTMANAALREHFFSVSVYVLRVSL